jgi:hypothetical protein
LRLAKWGSGVSLQGSILSRSCPLWVKSGHHETFNPCPLYPEKRTSLSAIAMSIKCQKQTSRGLFDHFAGVGEQAGRNGETERPRGLELDEEIEISSAGITGRSTARLALEDAIY